MAGIVVNFRRNLDNNDTTQESIGLTTSFPNISNSTFSWENPNHTFVGWSTNRSIDPDASEGIYAAGSAYSSSLGTGPFYAIWKLDTKIYKVYTDELTDITDVIREKYGASSLYMYTDDFVFAIDNIPNGIPIEQIAMKSYGNEIVGDATEIYDKAFAYCNSLQSVEFKSCTNIRGYAFRDCYSLCSISFPNCMIVKQCAFQSCYSLQSADFPVCSKVESSAFCSCYSLQTISFPSCNHIDASAFYACSAIQSVDFSLCKSVGAQAFFRCYSLQMVSLPVCSYIGNYAFASCSYLTSLYLMGSSICSLGNRNVFSGTAMSTSYYASAWGSIYVPSSLVSSYKAALNWSIYKNRIAGI